MAVVDKKGKTVYEPIAYDSECLFNPRFFENDLIYYNGSEMCFVNMSTWKFDNKVKMNPGERYVNNKDKVSTAVCMSNDVNGKKGILRNEDIDNKIISYNESDGTVIKENCKNQYVIGTFSNGYFLMSDQSIYHYFDSDFNELGIKLQDNID